jgi:DNA-binding FrmR family transcriptional regulator
MGAYRVGREVMQTEDTFMIDAKTKNATRARERRIGGQVQAIERMADANRYCSEFVHQLAATQAAVSE